MQTSIKRIALAIIRSVKISHFLSCTRYGSIYIMCLFLEHGEICTHKSDVSERCALIFHVFHTEIVSSCKLFVFFRNMQIARQEARNQRSKRYGGCQFTQIYLVYAYSYVAHGIRTVSIDFQTSTVVCKQIYVRLQRVIIKQCEIIVLVHLELAVCYYGILGIHVESCAAVGQQGTHSDIHSFNTFFVFIDNFHTGPVVQQISVYSGGEDIRIVFGGIVNKTFETQSCGVLIKRNIHRIEQNGASIQTVNIPRAVYSVMRVAL